MEGPFSYFAKSTLLIRTVGTVRVQPSALHLYKSALGDERATIILTRVLSGKDKPYRKLSPHRAISGSRPSGKGVCVFKMERK